MTQQHSPAPWGQEATMSSDFYFIRRISDTDGRTIAKVKYSGAEQEEDLANARLITASPLLLEELEKVKTELSWLLHNHRISVNAPHRDRIEKLIVNAEYVIEKAKGE